MLLRRGLGLIIDGRLLLLNLWLAKLSDWAPSACRLHIHVLRHDLALDMRSGLLGDLHLLLLLLLLWLLLLLYVVPDDGLVRSHLISSIIVADLILLLTIWLPVLDLLESLAGDPHVGSLRVVCISV